MIQFSEQAWSVFADDAENEGTICEIINDVVKKIKGDGAYIPTKDQVITDGTVKIKYEITNDRIIIKSIV